MDELSGKYLSNTLSTNNIAKEIYEMKQKENSIDFMKLYNLSHNEYEESLSIIKNLTEEISEAHIKSIISIKKFTGTYKHILELFLYLCNGELIFECNKFRSELNKFEIKFKMSSFYSNLDNLNFKILCNILNKVIKDKNFSREFLEDKEIGIYLIFRWIREVLKVYFYLQKEKRKSTREKYGNASKKKKIKIISERNYFDNKPNIIKLDLNLTKNNSNLKINPQSNGISSDKNYTLSSKNFSDNLDVNNSNDHKKLKQFSENSIYLTNVIDQKFLPKNLSSTQQRKTKFNSLKRVDKQMLNSENRTIKKELQLDFDVSELKLNKDKQNFLSLPLIKYKNFHELKRHYNLESISINKEIEYKNHEDLDKLSMKKPNNINKLVTFISYNRINSIDDDSIQNFILFSDEEFNEDKMKLEIKKNNKMISLTDKAI